MAAKRTLPAGHRAPRARTGRPPKPVDGRVVAKLAAICCTMIEIAAVCDCSVDLLERRFADVL